MNRKVWDEAVSQLDDAQFSQELPGYGVSVRKQLVHLADIDRSWIKALDGGMWEGTQDHTNFPDRESVREYTRQTEAFVRDYLSRLDDESLNVVFSGLGVEIPLWEALFHVVAHGVDHRSLLLTMLNQLGAPTFEQDYALYVFGGVWPSEGG